MTPYRTCRFCSGEGKLPNKKREPNWKKVTQALALRTQGLSYAKIAKKMKTHDTQAHRWVLIAKRKDAKLV